MIQAVISGDIINSSLMDRQLKEQLYPQLENFLKGLGKKNADFKGETNQGDWFQCLIKNPEKALRYSLLVKTYLRSFPLISDKGTKAKSKFKVPIDARIGIGIGEIDFITNRLGSSDGEAFRLSGRVLDQLKKTSRTIVCRSEKWKSIDDELAVMMEMLDFIFSKTTALQCEVIHRKLLGKKEIEIAKELNVLQSAVNQRSTAAGWNVIESAVNRFETIVNSVHG